MKNLLTELAIDHHMKIRLSVLFFLIFLCRLSAQTDCYDTFYQKGIQAIGADDFETAINNFKAAKVCPDLPAENDVDARILEAQNGYITAIQKARDEAIAAKLEAEAAKRSLEAITYISLGQEKELQRLFAKAIQFYSMAIEIFPDSTSFYEKRAPLYLHQDIRQFENAIADYAFLIKSGDQNKLAEHCDKMSYAYEQINQPKIARQYLYNARKYAPEMDKKIYAQKLEWFDLRQQTLANPGINTQDPASFSVVYRESEYPGYFLKLHLFIGGKNYFIQGNNAIINDLPPGEYAYQLRGQLEGGGIPVEIIGEGKLKIVPNSVYYCVWRSQTDQGIGQYYKAWLRPY